MKRMTMMFASMFVLLCVIADTWTDPKTGIEWEYKIIGEHTEVESAVDETPAIPESTMGNVSIPQMLGGYPVIRVGKYAFAGCENVTSVTIPNDVCQIGGRAFYGCRGLTNVTISSGVKSIGANAFCGCSGLTNVTIPSGVESIGASAFYGCSGLTNVTIPSGVESIGASAFYGCSGLTHVMIPSSVTGVENSAFDNCSSLSSVVISEGVRQINFRAFADCKKLRSVSLPSSVVDVGENAFCNCTNLSSVTIVNDSAVIHPSAFKNTPWREAKIRDAIRSQKISSLMKAGTIGAIVIGVVLICLVYLRIKRKAALTAAKDAGYNSVAEWNAAMKKKREEEEKKQEEVRKKEEECRKEEEGRRLLEAAKLVKVEDAKRRIELVVAESKISMEELGLVKAVKPSKSNSRLFWDGCGTFFVVGLACMIIGALVMSQDGMGLSISGHALVGEKGLQTMMWVRAIMEVVWIALIFCMSISAIKANGLSGFKNFFWGMIVGGLLAGLLWGFGSAVYHEAEQKSRGALYSSGW